jgi:type II secretory pathway pseudopilin PulG
MFWSPSSALSRKGQSVRSLKSDKGFSTLELMIALCIVAFIVAGANQIFQSAVQANEGGTLKSDADENYRAAMALVVRDMMQAGQGLPTGGIPIPSGTGAVAINRPAPPGSSLTFPSGSTVLSAVSPGAALGPAVLGLTTDMITILCADNTLALNSTPLQAIATDGSTMTVNSGTPITGSNGIAVGDLILFSNALGNAIQQVTSTSGTQTVTMATSDSLNLNQRSAPQGTLLNLRSGGSFPITTATRIWMITYYIDATTDALQPRLIRRINNNLGRTVAVGIENMQLTYDLVDGVTNPTNVDSPTTPNQIRKANMVLAVRSSRANTKDRQFFRCNLRTQISFRSLAFVDRYL